VVTWSLAAWEWGGPLLGLLGVAVVLGTLVRLARRDPDPLGRTPKRDPWAFRDDDRDREDPSR
jgi:hypothetical protein